MHRQNKGLSSARSFLLAGVCALFIYSQVDSAQQTSLPIEIASPPDGTVVTPGQTIKVVVTLAPGTTFANGIAVIGRPLADWGGPLFTPPFEFSVTVAADISPGKYDIRAVGSHRPGSIVQSSSITLIVERLDSPTQLRVDPKSLTLRLPEMPMPLHIQGTFPDGTTLTLNESTLTTYSSSNTNVATVDSQGFVKAVGEGTATITVTYKGKSVTVPVKVEFERQSIKIDIRPGDTNNRINLDSGGSIPVAILTTNTFDVTRVDPLTVRFGPNGVMEEHGRGHLEDVDGDGFSDMVLHFRQPETGIACHQTLATLTGSTFDGVLIKGTDFIRPRGNNCIEIPHR